MAEKKKMSVAEILAAARKADGGGATDESPAAPEETSPTESSAPQAAEAAPSEPVAEKPKPKLKPGERLSVADILAQARGETKVEKKPAAKKPAAKPAAKTQPAAKQKAAPAKTADRMDTASILAAARGAGAKRGPVSKAEAPDLGSPKAPAKAAKVKPPAPVLPEKPAYARPQPKPAGQAPDEGRRMVLMGMFGTMFGSFLATGMTLMTSTIGLWTLATARFMFPNILTEPPSEFRVGPPDNFAPGQVETKYKAQFGVWIINYIYQGQQSIFALSTVCTHLGCTPNWLEAEQKFKCPCHGSGFYKDGINFEGPAPRPLERYSIRIADDGQIEIDKSRKFQEEMGQWEDPASFVPV